MDEAPGPAGPLWTLRSLATAAVFVAVLALQIAVPASKLASEPPARFGWQMFTASPPRPGYTVRHADGVTDTVRLEDHVAKARAEIDFSAVLPAHLCRTLDGVVAVVVHRSGSDERNIEHPCP